MKTKSSPFRKIRANLSQRKRKLLSPRSWKNKKKFLKRTGEKSRGRGESKRKIQECPKLQLLLISYSFTKTGSN